MSGPARLHRPAPALALLGWAARHRWRASTLVAAPISAAVSFFAGDTAGLITGVYAATAIVIVAGRQVERARVAAFERGLDAVARLAAELRAGADPEVAVARVLPAVRGADGGPGRLAVRVTAATTVAEQTGAPLSELLDRLEADAGASARVRAVAAAHAAGARATAWLLAALPVAGVALGFAIGADPLHVLLHTPVGAAAALLAVGLQLAGLVWIRHLGRQIGDEP
jgi:tight adherence protein B